MNTYISKEYISDQYSNYRKASDCYYYLDGFLVGLLSASSITEEQYKQYRAWNEEAYQKFKSGDNDE